MTNLLLDKVEYRTEKTRLGTWRRHLSPTGAYFTEFVSHRRWLGLPLLHYTSGRSPETGRRVVAKGVLAVGRVAVGVLAIGQASVGLIAIGQLAIGWLLGLGQAAVGLFALGQLALGVLVGVGQLATGAVAVGQFALGRHVLAQLGFGAHTWTQAHADPAAVEFFRGLWAQLVLWWQSLLGAGQG